MDIAPTHIPDAANASEARRIEARTPLRLPLMLHVDGQDAVAGTLTEVSTRGCRIAAGGDAEVGNYVTIVIAEHTLIGGRITWREADMLGVDFRGPLLPKAIARICAMGS